MFGCPVGGEIDQSAEETQVFFYGIFRKVCYRVAVYICGTRWKWVHGFRIDQTQVVKRLWSIINWTRIGGDAAEMDSLCYRVQ